MEVDDYTAGPATQKFQELFTKLRQSRETIPSPGLTFSLKTLLEESGFVSVYSALRNVPAGKWAGEEDSIGMVENVVSIFRGIKDPVLEGGGFGVVGGSEEFDELLENVEKEINETRGAAAWYTIVYAQKPVEGGR